MTRITTLFLVSFGLTTGCGDVCNLGVASSWVEIEESVTIQQGIYGQYSYYTYDEEDTLHQLPNGEAIISIFHPEDGVTVDTYNNEYWPNGLPLPEPFVIDVTDNDGFFEFDLDTGDYLLCVGRRPLTENESEEVDETGTDSPPLWDREAFSEAEPLCMDVFVDENVAYRHDMVIDGWLITWL
jgi:hypothetical protein